jgi:hypothetical protein
MFKVLLWIILVVSILESMWDSFFNATLPAGSIPVIHNAGSGICATVALAALAIISAIEKLPQKSMPVARHDQAA